MLRSLATGAVLLAVGGVLGAPRPVDAPKAPEPKEFITSAITTGLVEDGVPPALAAEIGKREDFIGKCDLCNPTQQALVAYGKREKQPAAKEGKGLPTELATRLKSDNNETRRAALRELVQRYTEFEYARRDLAVEQKAALKKQLEHLRKQMSGSLPAGQKFCASCDGACCLAPKP
jgi:hypothetical protein